MKNLTNLFVIALCSCCVIITPIVIASVSAQQAPVMSSTGNSGITTDAPLVEPSSDTSCVPKPSTYFDADAPAAFQQDILATATVGTAQFKLINVITSVSGIKSEWLALIKQDGGKCQSLIPEGRSASLAKFMPISEAVKFAKARFQDISLRDPDGWAGYTKAIAKGSLVGFEMGYDSPMDIAPEFGNVPISAKCSLFTEESKALREMGIPHKCAVAN